MEEVNDLKIENKDYWTRKTSNTQRKALIYKSARQLKSILVGSNKISVWMTYESTVLFQKYIKKKVFRKL